MKIAPSMMCADILDLMETIAVFEKKEVEYLHIDVMDGVFVPNLQLGTEYIKALRKRTRIPLDIHLMITNPEEKLDWFDISGGECVSVHYESTARLRLALQSIKMKGAKPMLALNPSTSLSVVRDYLPDIDAVLLMCVNPGHMGQKLLPGMLDKISSLRSYLDGSGFSHVGIEVDGNVSFENAAKMSAAGADIYVAGSSSVFIKGMSLENALDKLRCCTDTGMK